MKSSLFEHYKQKYAKGGKLPVRKTGMWYQDGDVVVPSNEITMKGPEGEKDYFDSPILGIGMLSGDTQVMEPGKDYLFPNDEAVMETKKFQSGGVDVQERLKRYIAQDNSKSYALPRGLSINTGLRGIQNQYLNQNLPTDKAGDLSPKVLEALQKSAKNLKIDYSSSLNLPGKLGNVAYNSSYGLANPKSTKDLLTDLTYTRSFPGGNIRATADSQQLNLKSKDSNLNISRNVKDSKVSNQFNFNAQVLPEALSVYGAGQFNPNEVITFNGIDPLKTKVNAKGNVGVRGTTKNLDYDVKGSYDPKTGLNYQGDAAVRMFKDRLNVSGSATTKNQLLDAYNLDASLKLGKNLNLSAFRRNEDGEESYGARVKANLGPVDLDLYQNKVDDQNSYGATLNTNVGPVNLSGNANYNSNMMQDYNVAADVDLLRATKQNPNRGTLNLSGNYGASRDEMGTMSPSYGLKLKYSNSFQKGGKKKQSARNLVDLIPQITPGVNDVMDFTDIIQGAASGNRTQMNQGIIGIASPGLAGGAAPTFLDFVTEKTLGKDVADSNQSKREGIVNMSTSDLQKLYAKYGPGGYDKWKAAGFPKLQMGGMSIPGVNGSVISNTNAPSPYKKYKKK